MRRNSHAWHSPLQLIFHVTKMKRRSWLKFIIIASITCMSFTVALHMLKTSHMDISLLASDQWAADSGTTVKSTLSKFQGGGFNLSQNFPPAGEKADNSFVSSMCAWGVMASSSPLPKITIIFSIHNAISSQKATDRLRQNMAALPVDVTDDVIVTADAGQTLEYKEALEDLLDVCGYCRLFFLDGTIYHHRNFASNFARNEILVFADAMIVPTKDWLQSLLLSLNDTKRIVCPTVRMRYEDGSASSFGIALNEITWSLKVVRGSLDVHLLDKAQEYNQTFIPQTAISKEVFAISKEFFRELGQFDTRNNISGGEDVMFSLKAINCGGQVVVALCSTVYLNIQRKTAVQFTESPLPDFINPSFDPPSPEYSSALYLQALAKIWLDLFTKKYHNCVRSRSVNLTHVSQVSDQSPPDIHRAGSRLLSPNAQRLRLETDVSKHMGAHQCETKNFRYVIVRHQPRLVAPTKYARYYGYIRTLDGMASLGLSTNESYDVIASPPPSMTVIPGTLVLTRNASIWVGPFSFTNGAFIYHHSWCLTLMPDNLFSLRKCVAGTAAQLFAFTNHVIRPQTEAVRYACAKELSHTSGQLFLSPCAESGDVVNFKLDVEFKENCIK